MQGLHFALVQMALHLTLQHHSVPTGRALVDAIKESGAASARALVQLASSQAEAAGRRAQMGQENADRRAVDERTFQGTLSQILNTVRIRYDTILAVSLPNT